MGYKLSFDISFFLSEFGDHRFFWKIFGRKMHAFVTRSKF